MLRVHLDFLYACKFLSLGPKIAPICIWKSIMGCSLFARYEEEYNGPPYMLMILFLNKNLGTKLAPICIAYHLENLESAELTDLPQYTKAALSPTR
jgi:hypothetical protein